MKNYTTGLIFFIFLQVSCESGEEVGGETGSDTPVLKVLGPSVLTEIGFQLNWSITNAVGFETILILVAEDKEMTEIVRYFYYFRT